MFKILFNKYSNFSQLKRNMMSGAIFSAINIILTMFIYPIYLTYLGAEKYGLWVTVSVIISFSELGQLGMGTAIIKFVSSAYAKKEYDNITEYITTSFYLLFFSGSLVISILLFFKIQISTLLKVTN